MILQAVGQLDDLNKELETYAMRVRECHFPELAKIVQLISQRSNAATTDLSGLKSSVPVSMATKTSDEAMATIKECCGQVISLAEHRAQLYDFLRGMMKATAPNTSVLVGELVGARLIARAGGLVKIAKQASSTLQILGAEKALVRALKSKQKTPKYGIISHASLPPSSGGRLRGFWLPRRLSPSATMLSGTARLPTRAKVEAILKGMAPGKAGKGKAA